MIKILDTIADWQKLKNSKDKYCIFKSSNVCPISAAAKIRLQQNLDKLEGTVYEVVVQNSRDVSNQIATDLGIRHESPQLICLAGGEVISSDNHGAILAN